DDVIGHVREVSPLFQRRLAALSDHPLVGEARGLGLIGAVELVANKTAKRSFDPKSGVGPLCASLCQEEGLIVRPLTDTIALCPPLVIPEEEIGELFDRLERALDRTEQEATTRGLRAE